MQTKTDSGVDFELEIRERSPYKDGRESKTSGRRMKNTKKGGGEGRKK